MNKNNQNNLQQSRLTSFLQKRKAQTHNQIQKKQTQRQNYHQLSRRNSEESIGSQISYTSKLSSNVIENGSKQSVKSDPPKNMNVLFYLNKLPSQPGKHFIAKIHKQWAIDYERLERDHSFIQWIFPNSFQSRFNNFAKPLSKEEAEQFRTNPQIIKNYIRSYEMMLSFYGMKLKDKQSGEIVRSRLPDFKERFYKTLQTSFHNHMRITRILCSLTETGLGRFAVQLCKFLKYQIYDDNGALASLKKYNVYAEWKAFESYTATTQNTSLYFNSFNHPHHSKNSENQTKIQMKMYSKIQVKLKHEVSEKKKQQQAIILIQ